MSLAPAVLQQTPLPAISASITAPDIELAAAISPQDIQDVIETLESAAATVVGGVSNLAMFPANGFAEVTQSAQNFSWEFFAALINSTDNTQLKALLTGLQGVQHANLAYLVTTGDDLQDASQFWVDDMASLVLDTLNQAIAATVTSLASVINNPLALNSYTSLLGAAIETTFDAAGNLVWLTNDAIQAPLDLADWAFSDLALAATYSVANWSDFVATTLTGVAAQTGSSVIEGLTAALLAVTTTPLSILATGLGDVAYWTPVYTAVIAPEQIVYAAANLVAPLFYGLSSLGEAVTTIGNAPLDPASYVTSLQGLVTAGFNAGSEAIWSANQVAQIGPQVFNSLVNPTAVVLDSLTDAVAHVVSGLLAAGGAPQDVVDAPITFAENASNSIWDATNSVLNVSDEVANWLQQSANQAMAANNAIGEQINNWLGGLAGATTTLPVSATSAAATQLSERSALSNAEVPSAEAPVAAPHEPDGTGSVTPARARANAADSGTRDVHEGKASTADGDKSGQTSPGAGEHKASGGGSKRTRMSAAHSGSQSEGGAQND